MQPRFWGVVFVALTACVSLPMTACKREPAQKSARREIPRRAASAEEGKAFGDKVVAGVVGATEPAIRMVDWSELATRGIRDLDLSEEQKKGFVDGFVGSAGQKFFGSIQAEVKKGGSYKLIQNRMIGKERRVKLRLIDAQGAFNYHDFIVEVIGNQTRAVDVDVLVSGEPLSATVGRLLLPLVAEQSKGVLERLKGRDADYVTHMKKMREMNDAIPSNPRAALAIYRQLPVKMQQEKAVLINRIRAASTLEEPEYLAALEEFRKLFPNDVAVDVMSLDYFILRKKYPEALEALNRVEAREGADAYLNVMRANTLFLNEDIDRAIDAALKAVAAEPDLTPAVHALLALQLQKGDQKGAAETLIAGEARNIQFTQFAENPAFQALRASKLYTKANFARTQAALANAAGAGSKQ
jgi:hypothetical protein